MSNTTTTARVQDALDSRPENIVHDYSSRNHWVETLLADHGEDAREKAIGCAMAFMPRLNLGPLPLDIKDIAKASGMSERTVWRGLSVLEHHGWIGVTHTEGGSHNTFWLIERYNNVSPDSVEAINTDTIVTVNTDNPVSVKVANPASVVTVKASNPATVVSDKRSNKEKKEERESLSTGGTGNGLVTNDAKFQTFWQAYPKKSGKLAAQRAFTKAIEDGADLDRIVSGAMRYAAERSAEPDIYKRERFTKSPANWLTDGCWDDEPSPSTSGTIIIDETGNPIAPLNIGQTSRRQSWAEAEYGNDHVLGNLQ